MCERRKLAGVNRRREFGVTALEPFHISSSSVMLYQYSMRSRRSLGAFKVYVRREGEREENHFSLLCFEGVNLYVFSALFRFKPFTLGIVLLFTICFTVFSLSCSL